MYFVLDEEPDAEEGYEIFYKKSHLENYSTYKVHFCL
jgi:hypothetical protein